MLRRTLHPACAVLVAAAVSAVGVGTADGSTNHSATTQSTILKRSADAPAGANAGPPYNYTTELMGEGAGTALKNQVMLTRTTLGYRFWSGQQNSHTTVTLVDGKLRFADRGTERFKKLANACQRKKVKRGVAAVCRVPNDVTISKPLLIEIWPRLGDDYLDTSALPATFAVTMLSDAGNDVAHFGAGPDFFNGYKGRDHIWGGGANDWIRSGLGKDRVYAGAGNDDIVAMEGDDAIFGGDGDDRVWGSAGGDQIWGDAGADFVYCGDGRDSATVDALDHFFPNCETVNHS